MIHRTRSIEKMFSGAVAAQETETIAELKARLEELEGQQEGIQEILVSQIIPLKLPGKIKQPRLYFNSERMKRLKDSIEKHDVLEPILLRPSSNSRYEIISGERRWRCCKELGKKTIKAHISEMDDILALEAALIAHLLNEEISAIEQTESILSLLSLRLNLDTDSIKTGLYATKNKQIRGVGEDDFTDEQLDTISEILEEFGMALHSFISNRLPMLNMDEEILNLVREGKISPTNAVLINRQPAEWRNTLLENAEEMSKNELMNLIRQIKADQIEGDEPKAVSIEKQIMTRFKVVSRNKKLLGIRKVQTKLNKIQQLLDEIEALSD